MGKSKNKSKYPHVIHYSADLVGFATHTHRLTEVGLPELFIDPLAFGPEGNAGVINRAYVFFVKPENKPKLEALLSGQIVKLTGKDLRPESDGSDPLIYCFREVPPTFKAVDQAYEIKNHGLEIPGMRFVQIWIEGDDFALLDSYYQGGVKF
ncbi:MAG: hypothetical protein FJ123_00045 [Deltaproteobacteria bacterium]|nr:hypothetical protein [Deltaproteobacteria bacterium]